MIDYNQFVMSIKKFDDILLQVINFVEQFMLFTSFIYQWSWIVEVLYRTVHFFLKKMENLFIGDQKVFRFHLKRMKFAQTINCKL